MSRIAYVDGRYLVHRHAGVSVDDRAFLFGDGVYEVVEVHGGALVEEGRHLGRLRRSLAEMRMRSPLSDSALKIIIREIVVRNRVRDGLVYIQITRGSARRDHAFPAPDISPGLFVAARSLDPQLNRDRARLGVAIVSRRDDRWARPDVKSVQLLPNVLAKQAARENGAFEAWFVDDSGFITDGASTNAWIVTPDGTIVTRNAGRDILSGVTRAALIQAATLLKLDFQERPFSLEDAYAAREAFLSSATTIVLPVIRIDGRLIGSGRPGPVALELRRTFREVAESSQSAN